jgi:hypothetical protein
MLVTVGFLRHDAADAGRLLCTGFLLGVLLPAVLSAVCYDEKLGVDR